ncbi:MAG: tryptophan 2,3-dioxygenase family protein [Cytophagaceae bacterium]|jgi:tryptophan 2,3-dioxygenase|nr:tryptophan 2,3-dioxygenase family protein [Cytophagaceae bacterium]
MHSHSKEDTAEKIHTLLEQLTHHFEEDGQDTATHLEGLLHSNYVKYWEYIRLDTLLTLQNPKTAFPDEMIFIVYHQITELYFKMVLHELNQLKEEVSATGDYFLKRMERVNWYFGQLISSFDLISVGLDQHQFLKFRAALTPASGFQSVQYRMVEIASTDLINLVHRDQRDHFDDYSTIEEMFEQLYWKKGAQDVQTGKKTLTLRQFEKEYTDTLIRLAYEYKSRNIWSVFKRLSFEEQSDERIRQSMKQLDQHVNINWPLMHYKYALGYLIKNKSIYGATGGTNWREYLPPRFQKLMFFPDLYSTEEIDLWGKNWVEKEVLSKIQASKQV